MTLSSLEDRMSENYQKERQHFESEAYVCCTNDRHSEKYNNSLKYHIQTSSILNQYGWIN